MKTKFTVSKTGWGVEDESHKTLALVGNIDKAALAKLLDGDVFFESKKELEEDFRKPIKRNVKITVTISDVTPKAKKK